LLVLDLFPQLFLGLAMEDMTGDQQKKEETNVNDPSHGYRIMVS
jgi:hypothetical protein